MPYTCKEIKAYVVLSAMRKAKDLIHQRIIIASDVLEVVRL